METVYAYPGTFCPPHRGHVNIAKRMAQIAGKVTVVCSVNDGKADQWFTPEDCKEMWKTYDIEKNIEVMTFAEFMAKNGQDKTIVIVRGIRNEDDLAFEKKVLEQNRRDYGIENYHYLVADEKYREFSSTKARKMAMDENMPELEKIVNPKIAAKMIERAREIKRRKTV
jgi:pantetheine-phosphate adenylyltransferase